MSISSKVLNDKIVEVSNNNELLDMLMEFHELLEKMDIFAFKNWISGEILEGPTLKRHYANIKLMYPQKSMPDPEAVSRLVGRDCLVEYKKDTLISPVKVKTYDDVEVTIKPDGGTRYKAKTKSEPIWIVSIDVPRKYVDKNYEDEEDQHKDDVKPDIDTQDALDVADVKSNNFGSI